MASKFRNAGQTCICTNRLYVHKNVKEVFVAKLLNKVAKLKFSNGVATDSTLGPVITMAAKRRLEAVFVQSP
nr:aldehyde dehydrogenase family protein [Vibrio sp. PID17_43]